VDPSIHEAHPQVEETRTFKDKLDTGTLSGDMDWIEKEKCVSHKDSCGVLGIGHKPF
jgi:hypothetical protein